MVRAILVFLVIVVWNAAVVAAPVGETSVEALPLVESVAKDGITWKFDHAVRAGKFLNGDFYVVGGVTVVGIEPRPLLRGRRRGIMLGRMRGTGRH